MADITIYKPANLGEDPSPSLQAQVEALQAQVVAVTAAVGELQAKIDAAKAALA
jgi:hypothetical protein